MNKNKLVQLIVEELDNWSDTQINIASATAREILAEAISKKNRVCKQLRKLTHRLNNCRVILL